MKAGKALIEKVARGIAADDGLEQFWEDYQMDAAAALRALDYEIDWDAD